MSTFDDYRPKRDQAAFVCRWTTPKLRFLAANILMELDRQRGDQTAQWIVDFAAGREMDALVHDVA